MYRLLLIVVIPFFLISCTTGRPVNHQRVESLVGLSIELGLGELAKKYNQEEFNSAVRTADDTVVKVLIPAFEGAALDSLTVETVNHTLKQLDGRVDKNIANAIKAAILIGFEFVDLPENPTQKIGENHLKTILAVLRGLHDGMSLYLENQ